MEKKRKDYTCAVVKRISEETEYQINQLQNFLYETTETSPLHIPPVSLIFVDNFPEQQVHHLSVRLSKKKTKCVLLSTIPLDKSTKNHADDFILGNLDEIETKKVAKILDDLEEKQAEEAEKVLIREKHFLWLGLELFGSDCNEIKHRLLTLIHQVPS